MTKRATTPQEMKELILSIVGYSGASLEEKNESYKNWKWNE